MRLSISANLLGRWVKVCLALSLWFALATFTGGKQRRRCYCWSMSHADLTLLLHTHQVADGARLLLSTTWHVLHTGSVLGLAHPLCIPYRLPISRMGFPLLSYPSHSWDCLHMSTRVAQGTAYTCSLFMLINPLWGHCQEYKIEKKSNPTRASFIRKKRSVFAH